MDNIKSVLNVDWLCLSLRGNHRQTSFSYSLIPNEERKSRLFSEFFDLEYNNEHIAVIEACPKTPMLAKDLFLLKFDNHILYRPNLYDFVNDLLLSCQWRLNNINRFDICADFNTFSNNIHPQHVISNLFSGEWHRKGDRKAVFYGADAHAIDKLYTTKSGAKVAYFNKETNFDHSKLTGYRAGTRSSAVCLYIYNKSVELQRVKDKPYIKNIWRKADFDVSNVWRLEFSLHGKYFNNLSLEILKPGGLSSLFADLVSNYFDIMFTLPDASTGHVSLFETPQIVYDLTQKTRPANADRSAMRFISNLITTYAKNQHSTDTFFTSLEIAIIEGVRYYELFDYAISKCLYLKLVELSKILQNEKQKNVNANL